MIYHWDISGSPYWYDILSTMGTYPTTTFWLPSLNALFSYHPGTVVAIAGKLIPHSVDAMKDGDRVCFAWFMQDDVHEYLHIPDGKLSNRDCLHSATICS